MTLEPRPEAGGLLPLHQGVLCASPGTGPGVGRSSQAKAKARAPVAKCARSRWSQVSQPMVRKACVWFSPAAQGP